MSQHFGSRWVQKTRKKHSCGWCGKRIEPGSVAEYSSGVFEGDFWAHHVHPECAAARDSMTYRELEDGWCPGDFARGRADDECKLPPVFADSYRGKRFKCVCRDAVSGMEFDFDLESVTSHEAAEEANCKYNGVVTVLAREPERAAGVALKPLDEEPPKSLNEKLNERTTNE